MGVFVPALKRRAQRIRAAWLRRIGGGGQSALRAASRPSEADKLIDLLRKAAAR